MPAKIAKTPKVEKVEDLGLQDYELVLVFSPEVDVAEDGAGVAIGKVSQVIADRGGAVAAVERWGKMRLAYPIKHFAEGNYVLVRFNLKPKLTRELEASLRISEEILRHLLVRMGS